MVNTVRRVSVESFVSLEADPPTDGADREQTATKQRDGDSVADVLDSCHGSFVLLV